MPNTESQSTATPVAYASISDWMRMSGLGRTSVYDALGRGDLTAIKVGTKTLIDVQRGLAWLRVMPEAKITAPKRAKSSAEVSLAA